MPTKKMTVLVTGGKGLLGLALLATSPQQYEIIPTVFRNIEDGKVNSRTFVRLDITNKTEVNKIFRKFKPDVVIHTASQGNVDYCEKNKKEAFKTNVVGTRNILDACNKWGSRLVFTSTNAIFDGKNPPYSEKSKPNPLNYYGQTKLSCEKMIRLSGVRHCIVRLVLMYGWHHPMERKNPVTWIIESLNQDKSIHLVNDIFNNPIYNLEAAKAIWKIIEIDYRGTIHLAGKDRVNRYELGQQIAKVFGLQKKLLIEVGSEYFGELAPRMPDTTYSTEKMTKILKITPKSLTVGLRDMKKTVKV